VAGAIVVRRAQDIAVVTDGDTGGRVIERVLDLLIRQR
jgi:hypothetical protein